MMQNFLLEKAVEFKPDDGDLRMKYASILRKKQKFAKTIEQVNILCDKYPDNLTYQAQKASEIMQNGGHEEAIVLLDDILSKNPYNFSTLTSRGHAQKTLGRTCLLYTSPSPRDATLSRMPSSA